MRREPEFFKRLSKCNIDGQSRRRIPTFPVPIGNSKETGEIQFHNFDPTLEYQQDSSNSCFFSSLDSALRAYGDFFCKRYCKANQSIIGIYG